uniref:CCAAT-binding factor domain-containing protein n=1 Tax=Panagrolaimus sp. JU765 TaxID=591449 RepID=A0AC34QGM5_9BILA
MNSTTKIYKKLTFDVSKDVEKLVQLFENEDFDALHEYLKAIEPLRDKKGALVVTSEVVDFFLKGALVVTSEVVDFFLGMAKYFNKPLASKIITKLVDNFFKNSDMMVYLLNYWERNPKLFEESMTTKKNAWLLLVHLPPPKYKLYPKLKSEFYDDVDFTEKKRVKVVQTIWLQQIYRGVPQEVFLPVLRKLIDEIMDITPNSELYGDFLVSFVEKKDQYFGMFALEGVAKLMLEKNL